MKKEYKIKGVEKIIEKIGKERLAKYYDVDVNSDFVQIITNDFEESNIPSGLEVALCFNLDYDRAMREGGKVIDHESIACTIQQQDERKRALVGFNYITDSVLYLYIDQPIVNEELFESMYYPKYHIGGIQYNGLIMGMGYYEEHKQELENALKKNNYESISSLDSYVRNFMEEYEDVSCLGGYGPRGSYEESDEIRDEKAKNKKLILKLTGKSDIEELSLRDFINLKRQLQKEEQDAYKEFIKKFTQKGDEDRG